MPVVSDDAWRIIYTVSRYLFPLLGLILVFLILFYILSEGKLRREKARGLPGFGTVGELIVLSGSRDLDANTWFPVPREGVLGSVRSCDLVIPCSGVHPKHLDFSWEDGLGLLIRPRTGCEASVDGTPVTCRTDASAVPLQHGSILQVGSAMLRLHLFAALDNTSAPVRQTASVYPQQFPLPGPVYDPAPGSLPYDAVSVTPREQQFPPFPPSFIPDSPAPDMFRVQPAQEEQVEPPMRRTENPVRSDHWKEDMGE